MGRRFLARDQACRRDDTKEQGACRGVQPPERTGSMSGRGYFVAPTIAHLRRPESRRSEGFDRSQPEVEPDGTSFPAGCRRLPDGAFRHPLHGRGTGSPRHERHRACLRDRERPRRLRDGGAGRVAGSAAHDQKPFGTTRLPGPQGRLPGRRLSLRRCRAPPLERASAPRLAGRARSGYSIHKVTDDMTIATRRAAEKPSRQLDAPLAAPQHTPTTRERTLFARLPLAVAGVTDPDDRRALGALVEAGKVWLGLGLAG